MRLFALWYQYKHHIDLLVLVTTNVQGNFVTTMVDQMFVDHRRDSCSIVIADSVIPRVMNLDNVCETVPTEDRPELSDREENLGMNIDSNEQTVADNHGRSLSCCLDTSTNHMKGDSWSTESSVCEGTAAVKTAEDCLREQTKREIATHGDFVFRSEVQQMEQRYMETIEDLFNQKEAFRRATLHLRSVLAQQGSWRSSVSDCITSTDHTSSFSDCNYSTSPQELLSDTATRTQSRWYTCGDNDRVDASVSLSSCPEKHHGDNCTEVMEYGAHVRSSGSSSFYSPCCPSSPCTSPESSEQLHPLVTKETSTSSTNHPSVGTSAPMITVPQQQTLCKTDDTLLMSHTVQHHSLCTKEEIEEQALQDSYQGNEEDLDFWLGGSSLEEEINNLYKHKQISSNDTHTHTEGNDIIDCSGYSALRSAGPHGGYTQPHLQYHSELSSFQNSAIALLSCPLPIYDVTSVTGLRGCDAERHAEECAECPDELRQTKSCTTREEITGNLDGSERRESDSTSATAGSVGLLPGKCSKRSKQTHPDDDWIFVEREGVPVRLPSCSASSSPSSGTSCRPASRGSEAMTTASDIVDFHEFADTDRSSRTASRCRLLPGCDAAREGTGVDRRRWNDDGHREVLNESFMIVQKCTTEMQRVDQERDLCNRRSWRGGTDRRTRSAIQGDRTGREHRDRRIGEEEVAADMLSMYHSCLYR
eukprot:GHVQ01028030.1.p1 GENE.GHVQ01028030.1~~GHVQ01028030.1.p1  ORF type:complete len:703 (+),score=117.15 GHVQ01028030.1:510-2618(+)